jgi:hypothetical protein
MKQINSVEESDVSRLNGEQLPRLLHILLCAEARKRNIDQSGIKVPFIVNVADDGSDGEWKGEIAKNDYIPNSFTRFQCKAEKLTPAKCKTEMHRNGSTLLKPEIDEVLSEGGAYVFFCSYPFNSKQIKKRLKEVREALKEAGRTTWKTDPVYIVEGGQIARWVNQYASALAYVCRHAPTGQTVILRDFTHWSKDKGLQNDFHTNVPLDEIISDVRAVLCEPRGIARLTGPSGVGKTRLGFEIFHRKETGDQENIRSALECAVAYLDMQACGNDVFKWVSQLAHGGYAGILVVDNCSRQDHDILQRAIEHPDCKLSLLTLDYVPEVLFGDAFLQVNLTPEMMKDVVPKILGGVPGLREKLGDDGISRVAAFSHGYPQIAILIAQAGHALDRATLNQEGQLVDRLLWGRGEHNAHSKEIIRCLAPFSEIAREGINKAQIEFVRSELLGGISDYDLSRFTKCFRENRVLQDIGDYLMVAPPPLAAALAADWLEDVSDEVFLLLLPKIEDAGLTGSFCKRLRQLDFSIRAQKLCEKMMGPSGPFSSAEVLNSEVGSRVFRALVEVNPLEAANCLFRLYSDLSPKEAKSIDLGRRYLVWSLEKLCWRAELFTKAARVVRAFAAGETEHYGNNATALFRQLFHIHLSGTQCPAIERLEILREGVGSPHREIRLVSVQALGAALMWGRFSRSGGAEQSGTKPPELDWQPSTWSDVWDYWRQVFELLKDAILNEDDAELSEAAQAALGPRVGALVTCPLGEQLFEDFKIISEHLKYSWPVARDELKRIRNYHKPLPAGQATVLDQWLNLLKPNDLATRLVDIVSIPGWHQEEQPGGDYKDLSQEGAIRLADELYANGEAWKDHLASLVRGDQQQTYAFGRRCMELDPDPNALIRESIEAYRGIEKQARNAQLIRGMISAIAGTNEAAAVLDALAADPDLRGDLLVPLSAAATSIRDFNRVVDLVKTGELPSGVLEYFSFGGISQQFAADVFESSLVSLIKEIPDAAPVVLRLVSMFCFRDHVRFALMRDFVIRLVLMPEVIAHINGTMIGHSWQEAVQTILVAPPEGFVAELAGVMAEQADSGSLLSYNYSNASPVLRNLLKDFPKETWPAFEARLRDEEGQPNYTLVDLLCQSGRLDASGVPLWEMNPSDFRAWASRNLDLMPYLLHHMPIYTIERGTSPDAETLGEDGAAKPPEEIALELPDPTGVPQPGDRYVWHPLALVVLELCGKGKVYGALSSNIFSFGSTGSRVPYLEKRLKLMADLAESDVPDLRQITLRVTDALQAEIARENKNDAQRAAGINAW